MGTSKKPSLILQDRDVSLLRGLLECRIMTADHVSDIFFDGKREYTKKRLQVLKAAGLIGARTRLPTEPWVLFLKRDGLSALRSHGVLDSYPSMPTPDLERRADVSELTIRHELSVMDVKAAFHSAIKALPSYRIAEFCTWPALYEFMAPRIGMPDLVVKPDAFIRIHEQDHEGGLSEYSLFLEVDRSTETLETLVSKAGCYLHYYQSGGFAVRNGGTITSYKEYPFRVLMVLKSAERRNLISERLLQINRPVLTQVYLSTNDEVVANPYGAIWVRPLDYREALAGSVYAARPSQGYRRDSTRERFVEGVIKKQPLLS